ncbi:type IV pilus biogenesis protein PilM [Metabacillus sp. HB246100]|uniref:type IV pilus biogenesis protein PilM n=1 Tax=Bacillus weihaiensis TaxID=1547283 RepID=UPI0023526E99|nr:pilus assembly protein PilM [Bacillus weihaiensis]
MAFTLFRQNQADVSLYISNYSIQLLELKSTNPLIVNRFVESYLPEGVMMDGSIKDAEKLSMIIDQCLSDWGLKKKKVRFITPDSSVSVRKVKVPLELREDEIKGYLYLELGNTIHLPFEEPVFDFVLLDETESEKEILLFAAPEKVMKEYTALFDRVKLEANVADLSSLSMYRLLYERQHTTEKENTLLIEVKLDSINFSIFEQLKPIFTRHMQLDGLAAREWAYQLDQETQLYYQYELKNQEVLYVQFRDVVKEIEKIINFYRFTIHQGDRQITQVTLVGDNPYIDQLLTLVKDSIPSLPITHFADRIYTTKNMAVPSKFHTVLGLALKEV